MAGRLLFMKRTPGRRDFFEKEQTTVDVTHGCIFGRSVHTASLAMADTANWGKVERVSGIFTGLSFPVTNTGPGTIVWRTDDITIQFNQYHATFGGDEVGLWGAHAGSGTISITAQQLAEKANTTVDVVRAEANNPSGGFILSATVRIYNKNTSRRRAAGL